MDGGTDRRTHKVITGRLSKGNLSIGQLFCGSHNFIAFRSGSEFRVQCSSRSPPPVSAIAMIKGKSLPKVVMI